MKTRNGFVSNSSSSSFLVYGCYVKEDFADFVRKFIKNNPDRLEFKKLDVSCGENDSYIGRSPCSIEGEETGNQFKNMVEALIAELLKEYGKEDGVFEKCDYIEESWYNG